MDLIADEISHAYNGRPVLENLSLTVGSGEIVAVLGPSGCGKSTLLRILGGLELPDHGRVFTRGGTATPSLNPLTYVFQDFALVPWMTVTENIAFTLRHHPISVAEQQHRIAAALRRVDLVEFARAYPKQLSGGMRQRTAIARALAVDPAILLMDEPLSALDAQTRELLLDDLVRLWIETRFSSVYITHNIAEAVRIGHRVVVLSRRPGRIREILAIPIPIADRRDTAPELAAARDTLWKLIRDEAATADREMSDAI